MQLVAQYRVVSPFLSVRPATGRNGFLTVPAGAVVETSADLEGAGLVEILLNGDIRLAFRRDIRERTELIDNLYSAQGA